MPSVNPVLPASSENACCRRPEEGGGGSDEERGQGLGRPAGGLLSHAAARRPKAKELPGRAAPRCGNRSERSEMVHTEARTPCALPVPIPGQGGRPHPPPPLPQPGGPSSWSGSQTCSSASPFQGSGLICDLVFPKAGLPPPPPVPRGLLQPPLPNSVTRNAAPLLK